MRERIRFERELELLNGSENFTGYSTENYSGENENYFQPRREFSESAYSVYDEPIPLREHSVEWKTAYNRAAPENDAQKHLVAQLASPVLANETSKQAARVTALQNSFANTDLQTAKRLFQRLNAPNDFLGKLFHLTLHTDTRKYLLSVLDAVIVVRSQTPPKTVQLPKPPISGVPPIVIPPKIVKPQTSNGKPPDKPKSPTPPDKPKINAPRVHFPWRPTTLISPSLDKSDWASASITSAATFLGLTASIGLRGLSKVSLEDALKAAWLVFQVEQGGLRALYGLAGERAAEAFLKHTLGVDPGRVFNLNTIARNFPILDLTSPGGFVSVKVKGVVSKLTGKALEDAIDLAYVNDFYNMLTGDHPLADRKLDKAAKLLFDNRETLKVKRALPDDLKDFTEKGIRKHIQEKGLLQIPHDHVQMVRRGLGKKLAARLKGNKKILDSLGIRTDAQLAKFVNSHNDRIRSIGVTKNDLTIFAEAAASHLPAALVEQLKKDYDKMKK